VEGRVIVFDRQLRVFVPGVAVATARARVVNGRASTPRKTVEYQSKVALAARAAMTAQSWATCRERVIVVVDVYMPDEATDPDNVAKGCLDALVKAGAIWTDRFKQVRKLAVEAHERGVDGVFDPAVRITVALCS